MYNDLKYMASWLDNDPVITFIDDAPKIPVWIFWNGETLQNNEPPKRVRILLTGLVYKWEDFQKIRNKKRL